MSDDKKITKNAARCNGCGDVIESKHRHNLVSCTCGATFVDGGLAYLRRGFKDDVGYTDLSEFEEAS